jgi:hypothetical protein
MNTPNRCPLDRYVFRPDWKERLLELCLLEDGWLDGEGLRMSGEAQDSAWIICEKVANEGYPSPAIFPSPEGGIHLQWTLSSDRDCREIIVFELLPDLSYDMHRVGIKDHSYSEFTGPMMDEAFRTLRQWMINAGWEFEEV